jgi:hypothetical protein
VLPRPTARAVAGAGPETRNEERYVNDVSGDGSGTMGDDVYQPDDAEVTEDEGILDPEDTLGDRESDPYDEGWSPPERPLGLNHTGTTAAEQRDGESLDQRLAEEVPETGGPDGDGLGDLPDGDGEVLDDEVGEARSGRLVAPDEGAHEDAEKDMIASDVGIDGAAASAEEAAVHLVPEADAEDIAVERAAVDRAEEEGRTAGDAGNGRAGDDSAG